MRRAVALMSISLAALLLAGCADAPVEPRALQSGPQAEAVSTTS